MTAAEELARYAPHSATLLTLGVFDGVHHGHLSLIETLKQRAAARGLLAGVITFDPHPMEVLHPGHKLPLLTDLGERLSLLRQAGLELVVPLTFNRELSRMAPEEFVRLLTRHLHMSGLVLGPDFSLGRDRSGTVAALEQIGARTGFTVESVPPYSICGRVVSSTAIRTALTLGDVAEAALLLGRRFSLTETITTTSQRGGVLLGFPTANLQLPQGRALPRNGVYATIAKIPNGQFASVTNIGHRPTFGNGEQVIETHILDFCGHIYGATLTVEFVARLRNETVFSSPADLAAQIRRDVETTRSILGEHV